MGSDPIMSVHNLFDAGHWTFADVFLVCVTKYDIFESNFPVGLHSKLADPVPARLALILLCELFVRLAGKALSFCAFCWGHEFL